MIYTVVLNSLKASGTGAVALNRGTRYYNIDWSFLPQNQKFKVTFAFKSTKLQGLALTADTLVQLNVNLTSSSNTYEAVATGGRYASNYLGMLYIVNVSTSTDQRFQAQVMDNTPIVINDRPSNNNFLVQMFQLNGTEYVTPSTAGLEYVLTLCFEEL